MKNFLNDFFYQEVSKGISRLALEGFPDASTTLKLLKQRTHAAETLFTDGQPAESLPLLDDARVKHLELATQVAEYLTHNTPQFSQHPSVLTLKKNTERLRNLKALPTKTLDSDFTDDELASLNRTLRSLDRLHASLEKILCTQDTFKWKSFQRIASAALLGIALVCASWYFFSAGPSVTLKASSTLGDNRSSEVNLMDNNPLTAWQLEDNMLGNVTAQFSKPTEIHEITLINGINAPWNDRATKDFRLELFSGGKVIATFNSSFSFTLNPQPRKIPMHHKGVTMIKLSVLSFYQTGGGIAEMAWK